MLKLFKFDNFRLTISEEAFTIKVFADIWNRDKSKDKSVALAELGFVYHFCDPRSDYQSIVSESERQKAIIDGEGLKKWKPDTLVKEAIEYYCKFKPTAALLLEDTRVAIDKVRKFLKDIDLNAVDGNGKPIYTINTVVSAIDKIPTLMKKLDDAEKALTKDLQAVTKMRGGAEKSLMEDSFLD